MSVFLVLISFLIFSGVNFLSGFLVLISLLIVQNKRTISRLNEILFCLNQISKLNKRHNKSILCCFNFSSNCLNLINLFSDKNRKDSVPSGVPYETGESDMR